MAVKSGRSAAGARAASSHTGALLAASDVTVDALFAHAGVIRTDTVSEQFDVAALLASQPLPGGDRVAIVTNAGGPGIACADACAAAGLRVDPLGTRLQRALRRHLPAQAAVGNPVDMIASASAEDFRETIERLAADERIDAIVAIFIPPLVTRAETSPRRSAPRRRAPPRRGRRCSQSSWPRRTPNAPRWPAAARSPCTGPPRRRRARSATPSATRHGGGAGPTSRPRSTGSTPTPSTPCSRMR